MTPILPKQPQTRFARLADAPGWQVGAAVILIAAVIIGFFAYDQWQRYNDALALADRETRNASLLVAEHTAQTLENISAVLNAAAGLAADVAAGRYRNPATIHSLLRAIHGGSPVLRTVSWTDADGNRIATSQFADPPPLNVSDEEHFVVQRLGSGETMHIAAAERSKISGDWVINVSRRLQSPDGQFAGVVTAVVDPQYFAAVYRSLELGPSRVAVLLRGDGTILVREPQDVQRLGRSVAGGPLFREHLAFASAGTFHERVDLDGQNRIVSYARVPESTAVVAVSVSRADALAAFDSDLVRGGVRLALTLLVLFVGAEILILQLQRRRRADDQFRDLLESAPDAMLIVDQKGLITLVNHQFETLFGYARAEILGHEVEELIPKPYREHHPLYRKSFMQQPQARPMGSGLELSGIRKDGTSFPIEVSISPLQTPGGLLVSSAIRDVTARKQADAELIEAKQSAEQANRAKSDFLSSMSYELRTPLNAVIGFAQMLDLDPAGRLTAKQQEYCGYIKSGGEHLLELVNEVLDLSGIEAGRLNLSIEPVNVQATLDEINTSMWPLAEKAGLTFDMAIVPASMAVRADQFRLRQILINLVSNAIKYNRRGGGVTLSALPSPGGRVRLVVSDTGIGIAQERQSELFEPFHRLGAEYTEVAGTGIGLALSRKLVAAMGGTIDFFSRPGQGSTFWIELPVAVAIAPRDISAATVAATNSRARAGGYTLLYIEDNPANLHLMEHLIATIPDVAMLSSAAPALGLDMAVAHQPHVIVLDLNLPGMNGFEVLDRLKAMPETRDIPVLALTAAAFPRDIRAGLAAGFFRYLTKPLDVNAFLAAIDEAFARGKEGKSASA